MKKITLFSILPLLGIGQLAAQDYEYVPFVREGVKWVCLYDNPIQGMGYEDGFIPFGVHYYTLEMKGDTMINGKAYKPVHLYSGESIDESNDTVPVYVREEDKVVYGIIPDERRYWECPVGIGTMVINCSFAGDHIKAGEEFKLYDFSDPANFYENEVATVMPPLHYNYADTVQVGNRLSKRHSISFISSADHEDFIIEGIGYVGNDDYRPLGTPLNYFYPVSTGMTQVDYRLSHVIEDGQIVYKTSNYKEPESADYVPFVREGVKWVYYYDNPFGPGILDMDEGIQYYSFEMGGDVLIGEKYYKPVILTHYFDNEGKEKEVEDFIPVYLREEDKVVYAIHADGIQHPKCPTGIYQCISHPDQGLPIITTNEEYVLYDFNDPKGFYYTFFEEVNTYLESEGYGPFVEYLQTETVTLGNHQGKCHYFNSLYSAENKIIESVGYDGDYGMPLFYFERLITGFQVHYYLSHVIENGEIIYKGIHYNPDTHVGIDEVAVDRAVRPADDNYYNLMGQPVGKDKPTVPGIYIHQGKKIVVR